MKRLVSVLVAMIMAIGMTVAVSAPAQAACRTLSVGQSWTVNVDDDETPRNIRFYRSVRYDYCGSHYVIKNLRVSATPASGKCQNVRSFTVNPTSIAGYNPGPQTFACRSGGNFGSWNMNRYVLSSTKDKCGSVDIKVDRKFGRDHYRNNAMGYCFKG